MSQNQEQKDKKQRIPDLSLFNNNMLKNASNALGEADKQRYKQLGEEMFGSIDFEEGSVLNTYPPPVRESIVDIEQQIKDGLHPTDMEESEKNLLEEIYGKEWYKKWGFSKEDLVEIRG